MRGRVVVGMVLAVAVSLAPSLADARRSRSTARRARPLPAVVRRPAETPATAWPRPDVLDMALRAYRCASDAGYFADQVLTVIDYSLPSTERRLWVIDLARNRVLFHELVAHGQGSGETFAVSFSNRPRSRQTSLGLFRTDAVYRGQHGDSLRLVGLEPGVNDLAMERAIVIHGAAYVSPAVVAAYGRLGRSWGCPALDRSVTGPIIDRIKGGTAVFAYYPEPAWLEASKFLRCDARLASRD